jgi:glycosyltransferase involved in cell wall biosynthesis
MKVWLPYIAGGSGTDVFTRMLADGLRRKGVETLVSRFPHHWQYAPLALGRTRPPAGCTITLANSWNAFAFRRPGARLIAVEHLFVLDPALSPYKSRGQAIFHDLFVRGFEKATRRRADCIVAVSRYTAQTYAKGLNAPLPRVIINGIDTDFFTPPAGQPEPSADRPFRLLFVGNMSRRKGADMIPAIIERLGGGFELSYTAGLRVKDPFPGLKGARQLGRLDHAGVREEYRRADALLFPTRLEGLPLVAMEAMACGTPVVACETASLPEVVSHGETGLLCPLDDAGRFADAIKELRADPGLVARLGTNARQVAVARFSLDRMVDDYLALFSELLA